MNNNPRDIRFTNFANLLIDELLSKKDGVMDTSDWWQDQARAIIARRAYDLVQHVIQRVEPSALAYQPLPSVMRTLPDMESWPDENKATFEAWLTTCPDPAKVEHARSWFYRMVKNEVMKESVRYATRDTLSRY